jgi:endonuclease-3
MADQAFRNLQHHFFDWNEIRVSSVREVEESLSDLADVENKANRLISFLQEVFETTFSFDLESLHKKGVKQAAKQLSRYQAANDFTVAWVTQFSLGGHAIPLDAPMLSVLRRLGLLDDNENNPEALRASLEHLVPKSRGALFVELVTALAHDSDLEDDPTCPFRALLHDDSADEEEGAAAGVNARVNRSKPR